MGYGFLRLDLSPGDELVVEGIRIRYMHKTGRRAAVVVQADPEASFEHIRAPNEELDPLEKLLSKKASLS